MTGGPRHDVALAQAFSDRIIGLRQGEIVFDGTAGEVTEAVLTDIYGEEDWSTTIRRDDDDQDSGASGQRSGGKNGLLREAATG